MNGRAGIDGDGGKTAVGFTAEEVKFHVVYVNDDSRDYPDRIPEGHLTLGLIVVTPEQSEEKVGLALKILDAAEELQREFPKPSDESKIEDWRLLMYKQVIQRIRPLQRKHDNLGAAIMKYVVPPGEYEAGQILDELPEGAVLKQNYLKD